MSKQANTSFHFPEEIVIRILLKLPIKHLVKCTCVCKTWYCLIKSPSFIDSQLKETISLYKEKDMSLHLLRLSSNDKRKELYSLHIDDKKFREHKRFHLPYRYEGIRTDIEFRMIGSCNGIICLAVDCDPVACWHILWNPSIRKYLILPRPHFPTAASIGFGFDSWTNDYKLLRVLCVENYLGVELYSLNTNSWRKITAFTPQHYTERGTIMTFLNGLVHWIAYQKAILNLEYYGSVVELRPFILGFDMSNETYRKILLPANVTSLSKGPSLLVHEESLSLLERTDAGYLWHLWVMKEYGEASSWTKLFSVGGISLLPLRVLGFRKNGDVLFNTLPGRLISLDLKMNREKDLGIHVNMWSDFIPKHVESLVLLDRGNDIGSCDEYDDSCSGSQQKSVTSSYAKGEIGGTLNDEESEDSIQVVSEESSDDSSEEGSVDILSDESI